MEHRGRLCYLNNFEKQASEKGYVVMSTYDTKEEVNAVIDQLHANGIHAFKAHHQSKILEYDQWWLYVQTADFDILANC